MFDLVGAMPRPPRAGTAPVPCSHLDGASVLNVLPPRTLPRFFVCETPKQYIAPFAVQALIGLGQVHLDVALGNEHVDGGIHRVPQTTAGTEMLSSISAYDKRQKSKLLCQGCREPAAYRCLIHWRAGLA